MGAFSSKGSHVVANANLSGKVAIVTGPITGIGYETALMMASVGCHVILAGRGQTRLETLSQTLTQQLTKTHPNLIPQFTAIELDLTSFVSIHTFVTTFVALGIPCHYLFNNAGVMMTPYSKTVDGFEMQIGTNCMGHQYLTNLLMPTLLASAPARIINTSSMGHWLSNYDVNKGVDGLKNTLYVSEKDYDNLKWYGHSKLGNIYQAREWTHQYASQGVISLAIHPGVIKTELARHLWYRHAFTLFNWTLKNANQGAATQLWAALDPEWAKHINDPNFSFFAQDCAISSAKGLGTNSEFGKVWFSYHDGEMIRVATQLDLPTSIDATVGIHSSLSSAKTSPSVPVEDRSNHEYDLYTYGDMF